MHEAAAISQSQGGNAATIPHFIRLDFAYATRTVFYVMAGVMAARRHRGQAGAEAAASSKRPFRHQEIRDDVQPEPALVTKASPRSVSDTVARLTDLVAAKGLKVFAVIDHSGEARAGRARAP